MILPIWAEGALRDGWTSALFFLPGRGVDKVWVQLINKKVACVRRSKEGQWLTGSGDSTSVNDWLWWRPYEPDPPRLIGGVDEQ